MSDSSTSVVTFVSIEKDPVYAKVGYHGAGYKFINDWMIIDVPDRHQGLDRGSRAAFTMCYWLNISEFRITRDIL